jgi:hypothetical protein
MDPDPGRMTTLNLLSVRFIDAKDVQQISNYSGELEPFLMSENTRHQFPSLGEQEGS